MERTRGEWQPRNSHAPLRKGSDREKQKVKVNIGSCMQVHARAGSANLACTNTNRRSQICDHGLFLFIYHKSEGVIRCECIAGWIYQVVKKEIDERCSGSREQQHTNIDWKSSESCAGSRAWTPDKTPSSESHG